MIRFNMINNSSNLVKLILYIILFLNVRVFVLILYWKGFKGFHYRARLGLAHAYACISWLKHVNSYSRDIQKLPLLVLFDVFFRFMMLFMCLLLKAQNKVVYTTLVVQNSYCILFLRTLRNIGINGTIHMYKHKGCICVVVCVAFIFLFMFSLCGVQKRI